MPRKIRTSQTAFHLFVEYPLLHSMVFFYQIRGGPCKGELNHITLRQEDVICYVGRDKHENEALIAHGWPGDIWFHVDSVSSAHVYFRLNYDIAASYHGNDQIPLTGSIPLDCLPENCVEDMKQIVKHNSIEGSKMASAKIVWTPHSNLKKNFDMDVGQVTYHDTKLCRYGRCHKDRARIKALEKTKSIDHTDIDLYEEKKKNERALIDRRKQHNKFLARTGGMGKDEDKIGLFDPIESDRKQMLFKQSRQGDELSGIDQGVAALESLALGDSYHNSVPPVYGDTGRGGENSSAVLYGASHERDSVFVPLWKREYDSDEQEYGDNEMALFLLKRGYPRSSVDDVVRRSTPTTILDSLQNAWSALGGQNVQMTSLSQDDIDAGELFASRQEEKEVLEAIFGDDIDWIVSSNDEGQLNGHKILDSCVPVTTYEPPERYFVGSDPPPDLLLEIYASPTAYPFGGQCPIFALVGGGIPQEYLHKMTLQLHSEAASKAAEEEPGSPLLFTLITFVGEIWQSIVEAEGSASAKADEEARKARIEAQRRRQQDQAKMDNEFGNSTTSPPRPTTAAKFATERERRAYAASVVAQFTPGRPTIVPNKAINASSAKGKQYYDTGVSDASLIEDLFS
jgi:hypothetical protein